jgi:S-methylmethionine-dependent homocysteine/selenocysteine methylase
MPLDAITVLDGGMGRELLRIGAPFRQPEWSALALLEAPDFVRRVHDSFIAAGAEVITTNTFAVAPFHIGEARFSALGGSLAELAGRLGRDAVAASLRDNVRLAGSLPPVFGAYRPDLFRAEAAPAILSVLVEGLEKHVDFWLAETLSSIAEARVAYEAAVVRYPKPFWVSFTLEDQAFDAVAAGKIDPRLRSGESIADAASAAVELGAEALLFNCSHASVMEAAVRQAADAFSRLGATTRIGVYANAFVPETNDGEVLANEGLSELRRDLDPRAYLSFANRWKDAGASIIGGCCGVGPDHIAALSKALHPTN